MVVGVAFATGEGASGVVAAARRAAGRGRRRIDGLAGRGAAERTRWRRRATWAAGATANAIATAPVIDRVVDSQLQRVLRPVVHAVLDEVLALLETEPERIRPLLRGQREGLVDELLERLRAGAEAGDTAVDRLTFRVFHPGSRPEPAPPSGP
ncbi:hypothetical protein [Pseudosporangium ferrugineum]|uniref:Uncharacterized protein n=1 Tax=Pseudosporangium ferrugineum TaxID=439699 RepID=A0A2T0SBQ4_9ACTN|nr:hypothetical protein [Pseudosporangium ferrugineum]PRY30836.1 hypothetical protein CLV70_104388 [Pseudosporangium ferrugineum]